jgi:hypothetical protein
MRRLLGILAIAFASTAGAQGGPDPVSAAINSVRGDVHGRIALVAFDASVRDATVAASKVVDLPMPEYVRPYDSSINVWKITTEGDTTRVKIGTFVARLNKSPTYKGYLVTVVKQGSAWVVVSKQQTSMG